MRPPAPCSSPRRSLVRAAVLAVGAVLASGCSDAFRIAPVPDRAAFVAAFAAEVDRAFPAPPPEAPSVLVASIADDDADDGPGRSVDGRLFGARAPERRWPAVPTASGTASALRGVCVAWQGHACAGYVDLEVDLRADGTTITPRAYGLVLRTCETLNHTVVSWSQTTCWYDWAPDDVDADVRRRLEEAAERARRR